MSFPSRLLALLTGGAAARTLSSALDPTVEDVRQDAWRANPIQQLDVMVLADAIAQELATEGGVSANAKALGYSEDKLTMAAEVMRSAPDAGEVLRMLLRKQISHDQARKALKKHRIPDEWHDAILELEFLRLSPADLANAEQQGFTDIINIGEEAAEIGLTAPRLELLHQLAGLPPGVETGLEMLRRGIIHEDLFAELVRTGHTKTKWTSQLLQLRNRVLGATTYVTAYLKGWITESERDAGGALTGYTHDQLDLMYKAAGRPAAPGQMATAIARGIDGPDGVPMNEAQFLKGIRESDIRPEWGPMLYGIRYAYPPLFQINRLVTAGSISVADALDWATKDRYAPEVIAALKHYWAQSGTAAGKELTKAEATAEYEGGFITEAEFRTLLQQLGETQHAIDLLVHLGDARRVAKVRDAAVTAIGKAYLGHEITAGQAGADLTALGISAAAQASMLKVWNLELGLSRRQLTEAEILRAFRRAVISPAVAEAELEARGYTAADAALLLGETTTALTDKEIQTAYGAGTITLAQAEAYLAAAGRTPDEITVLLAGITPPPPKP